MEVTELKLEYEVCASKNDGIPVIIAAAGSSTRMNGIKKQFINILGIPVIVRTMLAFERSELVSKIIVVAKEEDIPEIQLLANKYMIHKLTDIVIGSGNRQESVKCGLSRLDRTDKKVLIHDGARPLVSNKIILNVVNKLKEYDAVTCAVKVKDTIKRIDKSGWVIETLNRNELVSVQTPQGVDVQGYKAAIERADNLELFTDDMSIMEFAGYDVSTVEGDYKNIKITTPDDIKLAEKYITAGE